MAAFPARDRGTHLTHWKRIIADDSVVTKTVVVDGEVAGNILCWTKDDKRAVGYWVGRSYWGRGIATDALKLFVAELVDRPLFGFVATHNLGSIRVLEKAGFLAEKGPGSITMGEDGIEEILMVLR